MIVSARVFADKQLLDTDGYREEATAAQGDEVLATGVGRSSVASGAKSDADRDDNLVDKGAEILERYEATPGCELVYAGYIDLFGNVWACLVTGPGWAELQVVRADGSGETRSSLAHIDTSSLQGLAGDAP